MERLTYKNETSREMICKYEDCDVCEEYCPHMQEDNCSCLQEVLEKLGQYEDAEEQGLLLRLPCKVGDRTYQVVTRYEKLNKFGCTCCTTACGSNCDCAYYDDGCTNFTTKDEYQIISRGFKLEDYWNFGKTVFLTKEEAEQKLAEMKGE